MYEINDTEKVKIEPNKYLEAIGIIFVTIIIMVIICDITLVTKSFFNPNKMPSFLGLKSLIIISESMEPTIMPNDAIFVKETSQSELNVGDIISFKEDNFINTHRIVEVVNENGSIKYRTKGDNNKRYDRDLVSYNQIEGKYMFKIPRIGAFIEFVKKQETLIALLITLILILIYQTISNRKILENSKKSYEYRKKLVNEKIGKL